MNSTGLLGKIHSIESMGTHDGPGIRAVVFLQGCRFRCLYCHNPDTWPEDGGTLMTVDALLERLLRYKPYFMPSGGGVTVSGGEPLLQAAFVTELFRGLKDAGIHTCLDTAGDYTFLESSLLDQLLQVTDLVLLDIKHTKPHKHRVLTGRSDIPAPVFARLLKQRSIPVWLRYVVVPGYTDDEAAVSAFKELAASLSNVQNIEFLPFHKMGEYKWKALNLPYKLSSVEPPSEEFMARLSKGEQPHPA